MQPDPSRRPAVSIAVVLLTAAVLSAPVPSARADDVPLPGCTDRVVRVESGTASLINTQTLQVMKSNVLGPTGSVIASSNCCFYAVVIPSGSVEVIDATTGFRFSITAPVGANVRAEFSPDWCGVAIVDPNGSVIVINLQTGTVSTPVAAGPNPSVVWGPAGCIYAIVNPGGSVVVVNGMTNTVLTSTSPVNATVRVEFSPDGCLYAVIQPGGSVLVYKTATGELVAVHSPVGENVKVTFGPDCTHSITDLPTTISRHSWSALKSRYR